MWLKSADQDITKVKSEPGKQYNDATDQVIDKPNDQLQMGIAVEKEHAGTYQWIKEQYEKTGQWPKDTDIFTHIAEDHLKELPDYYTRLAAMEKK